MKRQPSQANQRLLHYSRGVLLYRQGKYQAALEELEQLHGRDMLDRLGKYYLGMCHRALGIEALHQGRHDRASEQLSLAMKLVGRNSDLAGYLASLYAHTGDHEKCLAVAESALQAENSQAASWRRLAQAQWRAGRRPLAYLTLKDALRKFPDDTDLLLQMGLFHAAEEQYAPARHWLTRATQTDCSNFHAHHYLGLAAAAQKDLAAAVKSFQRAFELMPDDLLVVYQLSLAARAASAEGINVTVHLRQAQPTIASASHARQLAAHVVREGEFVEAMLAMPHGPGEQEVFSLLQNVVQIALAEHPHYADLHYHSSRILDRLGKTDQAIHHARRCLEINPKFTRCLLDLGRLYDQARQPQQALECVEKAIAAGADWPDVHVRAADLMKRCNQLTGARRHLQQALKLNANYKIAADALASIAA